MFFLKKMRKFSTLKLFTDFYITSLRRSPAFYKAGRGKKLEVAQVAHFRIVPNL